MSKFVIENIIEAETLNDALKIAHENIYFADVDVESVRVREVDSKGSKKFQTFGEVPTETDPVVAQRLIGDAEPFVGDPRDQWVPDITSSQ